MEIRISQHLRLCGVGKRNYLENIMCEERNANASNELLRMEWYLAHGNLRNNMHA